MITRPPFVPFKVPTHGERSPRHFVIHTTEGHGTIEELAAFFRGTPDQLGINYMTQPNGRMGSLDNFYAETYHVKNHNSECIGCENIGTKNTSEHDWYAKFLHQLWAQAWIIAWVCGNLHIPIRQSAANRHWLQPSGVCRHIDIPDNDHTDPGLNYPFHWVLSEAQKWEIAGVPQYIQNILKEAH